ncbi:DUF4240 domain-containing protein [Streptomyces sp. NPDC003299]
MEIDCFWALVEESGRRAPGRDERLAWLRQELCRRPAEEIVGFRTCLDAVTEAFTWEVWAAADHILGWCSDDGFTDFRLWLVRLGRDVFNRAVADPDTLAETAEIRRLAQEWSRGGGDEALLPEWECLDYVAMEPTPCAPAAAARARRRSTTPWTRSAGAVIRGGSRGARGGTCATRCDSPGGCLGSARSFPPRTAPYGEPRVLPSRGPRPGAWPAGAPGQSVAVGRRAVVIAWSRPVRGRRR